MDFGELRARREVESDSTSLQPNASEVRGYRRRTRRQIARTALAWHALLAAALAGRCGNGRCLAAAGAAGADTIGARAVLHLGVHGDVPGVADRIGLGAFWVSLSRRS